MTEDFNFPTIPGITADEAADGILQILTVKPSGKDELFDTLMEFEEKNPGVNTTKPDQVLWETGFSEKMRKLYGKS